MGFNELKFDDLIQRREHRGASFQDDRVDEDPVFINQTRLYERRSMGRAAVCPQKVFIPFVLK